VKQLKVKFRRPYNKRRLGQQYQVEMKDYLMNCWQAKTVQETFLRSVLRNEGNCWSESYKYVKRPKGNREIILAIQDLNGTKITVTTEEANILNSYYVSVICCDRNMQGIKLTNSGETFIIENKVIRKNNKSREKQFNRARWIPCEILKSGGEAITPYLARLLEISLDNAAIRYDGKKATVFPIYKGGDRLAVQTIDL
jgi:hypothetical protein